MISLNEKVIYFNIRRKEVKKIRRKEVKKLIKKLKTDK